MTILLSDSEAKTAISVGKYGGCLPICVNGAMLMGTFHLTCGTESRGGKGTPVGRKPRATIDHYIYNVPMDQNALLMISDTEVAYNPAKFSFIKTLPKVEAKFDIPSEPKFKFFEGLVTERPLEVEIPARQIFIYSSPPMTYEISGKSDVEYLDKGKLIMREDDELLSTSLFTSNISLIPPEFFNNEN